MLAVIAQLPVAKHGQGHDRPDLSHSTGCCQHYPNRVLRKRAIARELDVCENTLDNLVEVGKLPKPYWLNSIPVWMLYDVHAVISAASGSSRTGSSDATPSGKGNGSKSTKKVKGPLPG
jgi:hypothetical protein